MKRIEQAPHARCCRTGRKSYRDAWPLAALLPFCLSPAQGQNTPAPNRTPNAAAPRVTAALPLPSGMDSAAGVVHSRRLRSGVPLGGIGAGTFQLMTDGTISQAALADNGNRPLNAAPGCFAALWTRNETRSTARVLALNSAYSLPTVTKLDYDGLYPQANLTFPNASPFVQASLLAFSPLIPFDLKNSSFPAAAFVMRLKNLTNAPAEASVALSWQSLLPDEGTAGQVRSPSLQSATIFPSEQGFFGARFSPDSSRPAQSASKQAEMTLMAYPQYAQAVVTTSLWDAAGAPPAWWETFARDGNVPDGKPGETISSPHPAVVIAVRLTLKPGEAVDLPFAASWYLHSQFISAVRVGVNDNPGGKRDNPGKGQSRMSGASKEQGSAGEKRANLGEKGGNPGSDPGHYYEIAFDSADDAGRQLLEDWRSLYGLTEEWQKRLTFSNMPRWLSRRLINSAAPLSANTMHTRDGRFAFLGTVGSEQEGAIGQGLIAPVLAERETTWSHEGADALLLALFPQLAAQELAQFAAAQDSKGFVAPPGQNTSLPTTSLPNILLSPSASLALAPLDATAAYVLQTTQFALWTGDADDLKRCYPGAQRAVRALLSLRGADGLPEQARPASLTLWMAALRAGQKLARLSGDTAFAQECEAAAKQGGARMEARYWNGQFYQESPLNSSVGTSNRSADPAASSIINSTVNTKANNTRSSAANQPGSKTADKAPQAALRPAAPDAVCATDQLWGQWLAYQLDLGPLLPLDHLLRAAQSMQERNDRIPAVVSGGATVSAALPSWQMRADGKPTSSPLGSDCLLPASVLADAAVSIWQDQPEAGAALLRRLEEGRDKALQSPWQYPARVSGAGEEKRGRGEEGQEPTADSSLIIHQSSFASLAVAADWNLLYALQGFALDLGSGQLTLAPNIPGTWREFNAPVFAPTFWGRMEYHPTVHGGVTTFRLDRLIGFVAATASRLGRSRAELTLKTLRVLGPPRLQDNTQPTQFTAHVSVGQKPIGLRAAQDAAGFITLTFDSPLSLTAGDRLEVDVH